MKAIIPLLVSAGLLWMLDGDVDRSGISDWGQVAIGTLVTMLVIVWWSVVDDRETAS